MKTLFIGIIFTLLSAMSGMAHPYPWLKAPDTIPLFKEKPAVVQGWDSLLKEGKLTEFYGALEKNRSSWVTSGGKGVIPKRR